MLLCLVCLEDQAVDDAFLERDVKDIFWLIIQMKYLADEGTWPWFLLT